MDDWNDLRLVLTIVRSGSLTSAAKALGVNHSTTFRRLGALEARLGVRLFERLPAGLYAPTSAGERMAATAERIETETAALDRDLLGADQRLSGRLRVTCSETLAFALLTPCIAEFRAVHPGIVLDLAIDNRVLSLSRREADVALRVARPREPDLHGRKVADLAWALYGAPDLLARIGAMAMDRLDDIPLIGWEEGVTGVNSADWLAREAPEAAIVYRTNSVVNQMVAARAGVGVALLPCFLGDAEPALVRAVPQALDEIGRELWIVTHADLRRTARVRAFMDLAAAFLSARRSLLAGQIRPARGALDRRSGE
ncbi:MAG: LysR family transcriptional regulator [Phenylobacterium sp.]|uniref:LysR family transcriptional regulator n=1 Tax=Phenylobacterium sp. TaxID=1871053 RepID=UPI001A32B627|nr:LysR family transcriptional regulator [Phenylobacterium sp.]MBJ7411847.1 LysR family transcriptional regulator [Phenylobacterium sp.]